MHESLCTDFKGGRHQKEERIPFYCLQKGDHTKKPIQMKRQRTITQIKEQGKKNPEKQLSDLEIISLRKKRLETDDAEDDATLCKYTGGKDG